MKQQSPYHPKHPVRLVTAGSLFDGHDVAINIMRRVMQRSGAEVIHLGHNRSVAEIVNAAIQEDVQGVAITSYQGGHMEFFRYTYDQLREQGADQVRVFGGGGGTILPDEIEALHAYGITRIYAPDDGRKMGLQGMIDEVLQLCDYSVGNPLAEADLVALRTDRSLLPRIITSIENHSDKHAEWLDPWLSNELSNSPPVLGITGTGGAGKSSLVDELVLRYLEANPDHHLAILSVDPSQRRSGGALLGDRIRMNAIHHPRVFMRSMATRAANRALSTHVRQTLDILKLAGFDLIILESSGIGQGDTEIVDHSDLAMYVMTPEFGAASQLEKIDMLDFADLVVINKFDKQGAEDALIAVLKQYQRNHQMFDHSPESMPVFGTVASRFHDPGVNQVFNTLQDMLRGKRELPSKPFIISDDVHIIPPRRRRYLSEITDHIRRYNRETEQQVKLVRQRDAIATTRDLLESEDDSAGFSQPLDKLIRDLEERIHPANLEQLEAWKKDQNDYRKEQFAYMVRNRTIKVSTRQKTLSGTSIPKVSLPRYDDRGTLLRWLLQENVPGKFPYTAGVFLFKRQNEDPTRMFAGEGEPERTNRRFHYLSRGMPAKRLSTAFDSVTLYGENPAIRPDIYGKVGNSGVSIATLDDAKKLYSGFNLCDPATSVSMTINGPAAAVTAFFLNAAIDQQCELYILEHRLQAEVETALDKAYDQQQQMRPCYQGELPDGHDGLGLMLLGITGDQILPPDIYDKIKADTLRSVRGTVQADILKEDQAQNTCIFSTEFSLRLMGDVQEYFVQHQVRNFYSVSISGYHIAEAGANPITQLAFTLANGFTYVEYYLARGMHIDDFAPNLSFFFSNGIDAEYAVIGRVARRIWAKAMRDVYGANERSQKLKYHIQTSGRSLHAQEIAFNDIRTTLQALYAVYDNCNSLHTNAYDEAITTPTEESVRRAVAIQLIINKELGLAKNENPLQGAFIIEELTDLVEEAVLSEFDRLTERGGVLGAMESMYQRGKIQEESMHYETLKHSGDYPIVGVNTFLSSEGSPTIIPSKVIRATEGEKTRQINRLESVHKHYQQEATQALELLRRQALTGANLFECLMEITKVCSLGQISHTMFDFGGQYRRNM